MHCLRRRWLGRYAPELERCNRFYEAELGVVNWSRRFQDPIPMPDGSTIRSIGEAAEYATSLPAKVGNTITLQRAALRIVVKLFTHDITCKIRHHETVYLDLDKGRQHRHQPQ